MSMGGVGTALRKNFHSGPRVRETTLEPKDMYEKLRGLAHAPHLSVNREHLPRHVS
jgi:hypothetical protein